MTLTLGQLAMLGGAFVLASFGLNAWFARGIVSEFRERLTRVENHLTDEGGLLVRVAVLEDRRNGPIDRRRQGVTS